MIQISKWNVVGLITWLILLGWTEATLNSCKLGAPFRHFDVVVYGATPSGIMTSITASREGMTVLLFDRGEHLGGMVTGGLSNTDIGNPSVIGGTTLKFFELIGKHYNHSGPVWYFEPHVALMVFQSLLESEQVNLTVCLKTSLVSVQKHFARIVSVTVKQQQNSNLITVNGTTFVDSSYDGDLLKFSGVSYAWGRESASTYGETLAGRLSVPSAFGDHQFTFSVDPYDAPGKLSPLVYGGDPGKVGDGDTKVQAYNFRLCFSSDPANRVPFPKPRNYDPSYWGLLSRYLQELQKRDGKPSLKSLIILGPLPNKKYDINNQGPISTDAIGMSWKFPEANWTQRMEIWQQHIDYTQGFFYFLANDPSVPESIRSELNKYGLCKDEFVNTNNWPPMLYIRESIRMKGLYIFTQHDREQYIRKETSIGMGGYNIDTHNSQRITQGSGTLTEGDVERSYYENFEIPYEILLPIPEECTNLLVTVCVSSSHIGYGALRLEPQYMIMGESAGVAAALAVKESLGEAYMVTIPTLQKKLLALNQILSQNTWANPKSSNF
jgi:hypothetical protein